MIKRAAVIAAASSGGASTYTTLNLPNLAAQSLTIYDQFNTKNLAVFSATLVTLGSNLYVLSAGLKNDADGNNQYIHKFRDTVIPYTDATSRDFLVFERLYDATNYRKFASISISKKNGTISDSGAVLAFGVNANAAALTTMYTIDPAAGNNASHTFQVFSSGGLANGLLVQGNGQNIGNAMIYVNQYTINAEVFMFKGWYTGAAGTAIAASMELTVDNASTTNGWKLQVNSGSKTASGLVIANSIAEYGYSNEARYLITMANSAADIVFAIGGQATTNEILRFDVNGATFYNRTTVPAVALGRLTFEGTNFKNFFVGIGNNQAISTVLLTQSSEVVITNSVAETTLLGTVASWSSKTLAANFFTVGKTLRFRMFGYLTNTATPTLTLKVKLGANILLTTGAVATVAITGNGYFEIEAYATCRTTGVSGTIMAYGFAMYQTNAGAFTNFPFTVNTAAVTVDTTVTQVMDVTAQWGTASASNTIKSENATIEVLA